MLLLPLERLNTCNPRVQRQIFSNYAEAPGVSEARESTNTAAHHLLRTYDLRSDCERGDTHLRGEPYSWHLTEKLTCVDLYWRGSSASTLEVPVLLLKLFNLVRCLPEDLDGRWLVWIYRRFTPAWPRLTATHRYLETWMISRKPNGTTSTPTPFQCRSPQHQCFLALQRTILSNVRALSRRGFFLTVELESKLEPNMTRAYAIVVLLRTHNSSGFATQ